MSGISSQRLNSSYDWFLCVDYRFGAFPVTFKHAAIFGPEKLFIVELENFLKNEECELACTFEHG